MSSPGDPQWSDPTVAANNAPEWAPYDQTQAAYPPAQPPYVQPPYAHAPYPPVAYPAAAYPPSPQSVFSVQGPAPATAQASSIGAIVVGATFLLSCFGSAAGIAPLILGILGFNKANSVNRLWLAGDQAAATAAADSSKKLALWAWISLGIGIVLTVLAVVLLVVWTYNVEPNRVTPGTYGT